MAPHTFYVDECSLHLYVAVVGLTFFKYQLDQVDSGFQSFVSSLIFFPTFFFLIRYWVRELISMSTDFSIVVYQLLVHIAFYINFNMIRIHFL